MNQLIVFLGLIFTTAIGYILLEFFVNKKDKNYLFEYFPFAFGLGTIAIVVQMIIYAVSAIPWFATWLVTPWILLLIIFIKKINLKKYFQLKFSLIFFDKILILLLLCLVFYVTIQSQLRPLYAWDGIALWFFKAKVFFIDKGFLSQNINYLENGYPYFISIYISFLYSLLGKIDDKAVLLFYPFMYIVLGCSFYAGLQNNIGKTKALLMIFLLLSTQNIIRTAGRWEAGYADLPLGIFMFLTILLFQKFTQSKNVRLAILIQIFISAVFFIKNEGFVFSIIMEILLTVYLIINKRQKLMASFVIWFLTVFFWFYYKNTHQFVSEVLISSTKVNFNKIPAIIFYMSKELINFERWNMLWIVFVVTFFFNILKKKNFYIETVLVVIFAQTFAYFCIYIISPIPPNIHIPNSFDRLLLHIAPLALYTISLVIFSRKAYN